MIKRHRARLAGVVLLVAAALFSQVGCSESGSNPADVGNDPPVEKVGFGVSGLLFENNLVMWFRENDGTRSELFPQMYFTRADAENFPVWGKFPQQFMVSGGVARDGIPALVNPPFVALNSAEASFLDDRDLVLGAVVNGEAKAYPERILWQHEIVNDVIGGEKVIMSFCPLTGSGLLFRFPDDGNQVRQLELLPVIEVMWGKWKELYPESKVVSGKTGFTRNYGIYPYGTYRDPDTPPLFGLRSTSIDRRFPPKERLLGLIGGDVQRGFPFSRLKENPVVNDGINNKPVLVLFEFKSRLALPYERRLDGRTLSFDLHTEKPFQVKDRQTGSIWNIKGEAISGELAGSRLRQIPAYNAFWFAWKALWPQTQVF